MRREWQAIRSTALCGIWIRAMMGDQDSYPARTPTRLLATHHCIPAILAGGNPSTDEINPLDATRLLERVNQLESRQHESCREKEKRIPPIRHSSHFWRSPQTLNHYYLDIHLDNQMENERYGKQASLDPELARPKMTFFRGQKTAEDISNNYKSLHFSSPK